MKSIFSAVNLALILSLSWNYIWFRYIDPKLDYTMRTIDTISPATLFLPMLVMFFTAFLLKEKIPGAALATFIITTMLVFPATYFLSVYYLIVGHLPFTSPG